MFVNHNSFIRKTQGNFHLDDYKRYQASNCKHLSLQPAEKTQVKRHDTQCLRLNPLPQTAPTFKGSNAAEWGVTGSPNHPKIGLEGGESHLM